MTRELVNVTATAQEMLDDNDPSRLMEHSIFHLIVPGDNQRFRGMLSISDFLRAVESDEQAEPT